MIYRFQAVKRAKQRNGKRTKNGSNNNGNNNNNNIHNNPLFIVYKRNKIPS